MILGYSPVFLVSCSVRVELATDALRGVALVDEAEAMCESDVLEVQAKAMCLRCRAIWSKRWRRSRSSAGAVFCDAGKF